jgi:hypothetical protein
VSEKEREGEEGRVIGWEEGREGERDQIREREKTTERGAIDRASEQERN